MNFTLCHTAVVWVTRKLIVQAIPDSFKITSIQDKKDMWLILYSIAKLSLLYQ